MSEQAPSPAPQPAQVQGERHVSAVAGRSGFTKKQGALAITCATAAAVAFILLRPQPQPVDRDKARDERLQVRSFRSFEPPPLPPAPPTPAAFPVPPPQLAPPALPTQQGPMPPLLPMQPPPDPLARARHAPIFAYGSSGGAGQHAGPEGGGPGGPMAPEAAGPNDLAARLQPTPISSVTATVLRNQPYLLTRGNTFPCVLQTAMDNTLPGLVSCRTPYDVIGKTGITLLDRGTLITGEYQGGMQQGQSRLFVLWTRAETPKGVVINLNSPAADPLGRTGFDGEVNTHFWARLGGALLLSVVQGGLQAGVAAASKAGSTNINLGSVESVAAEALRGGVNIRPTLTKNQGELVSVAVARDLDFSTAYAVSTVPAARGGRR